MKWLLPPILWIFAILTMIAGVLILPTTSILPPPLHWIGALIFVGLLITVAGSRRFKVEETNIKTFDDPDKLVTTGLFSRSRNPMYLGFCLSLLGVAIMLNQLLAMAIAAGFFLVCQFWYIPFEEAAARKKFGTKYDEYCAQVRRWV